MIIDATDLILGRLASFVAKKSLLGETIDIINCENAVVTGNKVLTFDEYKNKIKRGIPAHGPFFPRMPDMLVRRTIRGMLPYKRERGKEAFKRIKCYISVPEQLKGKKSETIAEANISGVPSLNYVTIREVCKKLGAKWQE